MSALRRRRQDGRPQPAGAPAADGPGLSAPEAGTGSANTSANGVNRDGVVVDQPSSNRPSSNRPGLNGSEPGGSDESGVAAPEAGVNGSGPVPGGEQRRPEVPPPAKGAPAKRHRWLPRTVRHLAELLLVGFIVEYFVVPQISGTHKAVHVLASVNPFLPVLGVLLEMLSLVCYFELTRALIPKSSDPGFATLSRIQLSTLALSHCLPGGNAMGYSLGYRLLMRSGVGGTDTGGGPGYPGPGLCRGAQRHLLAGVTGVAAAVRVPIGVPVRRRDRPIADGSYRQSRHPAHPGRPAGRRHPGGYRQEGAVPSSRDPPQAVRAARGARRGVVQGPAPDGEGAVFRRPAIGCSTPLRCWFSSERSGTG